MDAQVAWDPLGSCSCWHGVTSVVMSNCGFALAPCKPEDRDWYARCLSAVEDIPTEAMAAGIDWTWETFPEYLATVERLPKAINYGMYIGHSALRMYVMGKRALDRDGDRGRHGAHGRRREGGAEGGRHGLLELARLHACHARRHAGGEPHRRMGGDRPHHRARWPSSMPASSRSGRTSASGARHRAFLDRLRKVALDYKRPIMFGVLATKQGDDPTRWRYQTKYIDDTVAAGGRMFGQGTTRSINAIFSLKSYLPFDVLPAWQPIRALPLAEQKKRLRDPAVRRAAGRGRGAHEAARQCLPGRRRGDHGSAQARLRQPVRDEGRRLGRSHGRPARHGARPASGRGHDRPVAGRRRTRSTSSRWSTKRPTTFSGILKHPRTLATFSDSGAHVCQEMGSSLQTHLLSYWVRKRGAFTLEQAIKKLTHDNAAAWDLNDRGLVREGYKADLVLFEENGIRPRLPTVEKDLPGGARRLVQKAEGIKATVVNGAVAFEDGEATGAYAGQVLKGKIAS